MSPFRHLPDRLSRLWNRSIRRQLAWSFSVVALGVILGAGYLLFVFQRDFLYAQGTRSAFDLARTVAFSSTSWVLADDVAGLQEVLNGVAKATDIKFAVVLSPRGEVLASSKAEYVGKVFSDEISQQVLGIAPQPHVLLDNSKLIDVVAPIEAGSRLIGWARVELTRDTANADLRWIVAAGLGIATLLALMISVIATRLAHWLTGRLERLSAVADDAEHGRPFRRELADSTDEIGVLARHLYRMLDAIDQEKKAKFDSEARLRTIFVTLNDLIWLKDPEGVYLACNPMFERFFGASEAEIVGKTDYDFVDRELADFFCANDRRAMEAGKPTVNEEWVVFADDAHRALLETVKTPMHDASGRLIGILGIARDITERKQAENALRERHRELAEAQQLAKLGSWSWNSETDSIHWSEELYRIFGRPLQSPTPNYQEYLRLFSERSRQQLDAAVKRAMSVGEPYLLDLELAPAEGVDRWITARAEAVRNERGAIVGLRGTVLDISDRKAVEDALRKALRESDDLYNNAASGYHSLGPDGTFLRINDTELNWLGYKREEIVGCKRCVDLLTPASVQVFNDTFPKFVEGTWMHDVELDMVRQDGSVLPVLVSATAVKDSLGRFLMSRSTVYDLTERRSAERRQNRLHRALRLLSECNAALVHATEEHRLLTDICRLTVETGGYMMAWVGLAQQDIDRTVKPVSQFGIDDGYLATADISWADTERGRGPTGTAVRTGLTQVNQGFVDGQSLAPWREAALQHGFQASIALPLKDEDSTFGALTIYAAEPNAFGREEVQLLEELANDLAFGIATLRTRAGRLTAEEKLAFVAHHDILTDLPNRLLLNIHLNRAIERSRRRNTQTALLFVDLDRFQAINESLGHGTGDEVLVATARRIRGCLRQEDTLARWGGDEFVVVVENVRCAEDVGPIADNLIRCINSPFAPTTGNKELILGASIGIALHPTNGESSMDLLRNAESAMFRAKDHGRNQFCYYTPAMNAGALALLTLETDLRQALERGELVLHYQPKVDIRSGQIVGAEALMRWRHGDELVPPSRFIPLAERTALIVEMGNWAIDKACAQMRQWLDAGLPETRVAVNVSARQFNTGDLEQVIAEALARHQIRPDCLELELTESILMEQAEQAVVKLDRLRRIGIKVFLDDFGTGYSSLAYLKRFPIDHLKIDLSLIKDIVTEPSTAVIAISIIALAHRMHLRVIAEGVETEAQLNYLRLQGCDEIQGYFFSPPVPAEAFASFLGTGKSLPTTPAKEAPAERTILLVDDEPNVISALRRVLRREGYRVFTADNGFAALEVLAMHPVQVILSDQRMPQMSGTDFLRRVKELHPDTVRIVLSGYSELETITSAVNEGAIYKFLHKPWDDELLREHIRDAFLYHEAVIKPRGVPVQS